MMSRFWVLSVLSGLLFLAGARPALAQAGPQITLFPLSCILCETRMAPDGKTAAVFENRDIVGSEVASPAKLAITLIDTADGRTLSRLSGQTDYTADAAFSPDSRYLASLHPNGDLRLWDVKTRKAVWERFIGGGVGRVAFTPDGATVVVSRAGMPQSLWLVDRESGTVGPILSWRFDTFSELLEVVQEASGAFTYMFSAWAVAPDGAQIAAATLNDEIWLFDLAGSAPVRIISNTERLGQVSIRQLGYTPDGGSLYFADNRTHSPRLWSLDAMTDTLPAAATAQPDGEQPDSEQTPFDLYGLALSFDGETFAWVEQNEEAGERGLPQLLVAPAADWSQPSLRIDLPEQLRASPPVRVFWTPDGRIVAGGFVNFTGENVLVVVEP